MIRHGVLSQRLAYWLNRVVDAGRFCKVLGSDEEPDDKDDFQSEALATRPALVEHTYAIGQVPENAVVTAEQAESALGRTLATEIDIGKAMVSFVRITNRESERIEKEMESRKKCCESLLEINFGECG